MITLLQTLDLTLVAFGVYLVCRVFQTAHAYPLPPGPRGLPLLGNVLDMPRSHEWLTFAKWADRWGQSSPC